jgi:hypothetical protein
LAIIAGMTTDVTGFIACDCAADRGPLSERLRAATGRRRGGHSLGPPHLGTWIVKSRRHVVAAGDLDATETAGSMTSSERCRA